MCHKGWAGVYDATRERAGMRPVPVDKSLARTTVHALR